MRNILPIKLNRNHSEEAFNFSDFPHVLPFIFGGFIFGAALRTILQKLYFPYSVFLFFLGTGFGILTIKFNEIEPYTHIISYFNDSLVTHILMPVLVFTAAFEIESHTFWKSFFQVVLLSVPGLLLNSALIALLAVEIYTYNWSWYIGMMFGVVLSSTNPVIAVSILRSLGSSKAVTFLMEGEALFNDGSCIVLLEIFRDLAVNPNDFSAAEFSLKVILKMVASPLFGFIMSKITTWWLSRILNDGICEITISLSMTYITFYIAECLGMSGIVALIFMGLLQDAVHLSPDIEVFIIRLLVIIFLSPLLYRLGYGFNWRWGAVVAWNGIRGCFCLSLAFLVLNCKELDEYSVRNKILLYTSGIVMLTMLINATTMKWFLKMIGMGDISAAKHMAMITVIQHLRECQANTFSLLKMDRFLADANWAMAEKAVKLEDPYRKKKESIITERLKQNSVSCKYDEGNKNATYKPSVREFENMMEEARIRMLKAQKTSYWKQYTSGMLTRKAAQTLIGLTENITDIQGQFLTIAELKKFLEIEGFLVSFKRVLEDLMYNVKTEKLKPSKNLFLKFFYKVVFNDTFECFVYVLVLMNVFPIILEYTTLMSTINTRAIAVVNEIFFILYVMEAVCKCLAMRKTYIFNHWNQFDLFIIIMAAIDIVLENLYGVNWNMQILRIIRITRLIRITRILRLIKTGLPKVINIINKNINKQLRFAYDVGMGYVHGEEYVTKLLDQIADQKIVAQELRNIIEVDRQQAIKELGMLQRNYPEVAISVKTTQAIRTVLNSTRDTIQTFISGGLIEENDALKLQKLIDIKMRQLSSFPSTISPPTAEELLQNVPWLENSKKEIHFIKSRAKLFFYDYGDIIMHEGEPTKGIHLIVSGLVKVSGTAPSFGNNRHQQTKLEKEKKQVIDFRGIGTIFGELNCLTQQPTEATVTSETASQTCFVSSDDLFEAFDIFNQYPSLEYKIWRTFAVRTSISILMEDIAYQGWTYNRLYSYMAYAYVEDIEMNRKAEVYDGNMDDVVLVYGSCEDCQTTYTYDAPFLIPKTTHQVVATANITKILIIPSSNPGEKNFTDTDKIEATTLPFLHVTAPKRVSRDVAQTFLEESIDNQIQFINKTQVNPEVNQQPVAPKLQHPEHH
ncbi:sperm-specific sodium:proton exchanger-like isoform X2 [Latimeria chalumnae]|uniref:sperm-specific sodium:proton exchanger-like isoform X2 n=1 Tax=Latimeria chalumnae TaxID=7897 RepID=UPI0006D91B06|nr:PREDICTED: sodium/hydrogen exchanger 10-like isoform X2 [Latimeria chalumnae]|eukprot:XP_014349995.1 PREDICTED: sodium/hydrogen exchanger 10-like isoform X2 [Latimeria chalumnae]